MRMHLIQQFIVTAETIVEVPEGGEPPLLANLWSAGQQNRGGKPEVIVNGQSIGATDRGCIRFTADDVKTIHYHEADDQSDFRKREYWKERW